MRITSVKPSSKCRDGSLVREYLLNSPVDHQDMVNLQGMGEVILKNLGGNELFTFSSDILTLKGMIGDTLMYGTYRKEETEAVDTMMNEIFG